MSDFYPRSHTDERVTTPVPYRVLHWISSAAYTPEFQAQVRSSMLVDMNFYCLGLTVDRLQCKCCFARPTLLIGSPGTLCPTMRRNPYY